MNKTPNNTANDGKVFNFKISGLPSNDLVYCNNVFLNSEDFKRVQTETATKDKIYFSIKNFIFAVKECNDVVKGYISMSKIFRDMIQIPGVGDLSVSCMLDI